MVVTLQEPEVFILSPCGAKKKLDFIHFNEGFEAALLQKKMDKISEYIKMSKHPDFVQLDVPEEYLKPARTVLEMVRVLQKRGYPVRARCTIGANTLDWFCAVEQLNQDQVKAFGAATPQDLWNHFEENFEGAFAQYKFKAHGQNYFGWKDTAGFTPDQLADRFLEKYKGFQKRDASPLETVYIKWLDKVLHLTKNGVFYEHFGVGICPKIDTDIPSPLEILRSGFSADKKTYDASKTHPFLA